LLNEFLTNLKRLGLLHQLYNEEDASRRRRVQSYLQKFEAIYGDLPPNIHDDVLENNFRYYSREETGRATSLSTATIPVMLSTVLIAIGWLITLPPGELVSNNTPWVQAFKPTAAPVALAFLGAYFFSLQMLFRRYVLNDLGGTAYVAVSIRIILAVIGIWILMVVGPEGGFSDTQLLVWGFVFGVFPRVIWQIIESLFKKMAGFVVPSMTSQFPVSDLDGLTVWHEARLQEEDIENIPNMADADLVHLSILGSLRKGSSTGPIRRSCIPNSVRKERKAKTRKRTRVTNLQRMEFATRRPSYRPRLRREAGRPLIKSSRPTMAQVLCRRSRRPSPPTRILSSSCGGAACLLHRRTRLGAAPSPV
jgi:hypothetical protein